VDDDKAGGLDSLFGRIAMGMGFVTPEQLLDCVDEQNRIRASGLPSGAENTPRLGEIMLGKGMLTMEQRDEVLIMQEAMLAKKQDKEKSSLGEMLLGQVAVREGFVGKRQLQRCLGIQAAEAEKGNHRRLGKILLEMGYLLAEDLRLLLMLQNRTLMECVSCGTKYNVEGYKEEKQFLCNKCGSSLKVCADSEHAVADDTVIFELLREIEEEP